MRYCLLSLFVASSLFPLPQGVKIVQGDAGIEGIEQHLQIKASDGSILHWQDFSIASSESVQFIQPSANARVLNRVQGDQPSQIMGHLGANGQVYLINPHGVIFGKEATVLVSGLFVSTLDCPNEDFSLNQDHLFQGESKESILNYGTITALEGDITLLGRVIENRGSLFSSQGEVVLAAGQEILLRPGNAPILTICPKTSHEGVITHTGTIEALKAEIQAEGQAYGYGINIEGTVLALNPVQAGGKIYLKSDGVLVGRSAVLQAPQGQIEIDSGEMGLSSEGSITAEGGRLTIRQDPQGKASFQSGTLDVSGPKGGIISIDAAKWIHCGKMKAEGNAGDGGSIAIRTEGGYIETVGGTVSTSGAGSGGKLSIQSNTSLFSSGTLLSNGEEGGEISLRSPSITLVSANVDVSADKNGGSIQIGPAPEVKKIHLGGDSRLCANSLKEGNGGQILIFSEESTVCYGSIEARGGALGGDGGRIEVSGQEGVGCFAQVNASAPLGFAGIVLLDPKNIVVDAVAGIYPQYQLIDPSIVGTGFGTHVVALSTGNFVVTKPQDNTNGASAGAVYLYNGTTAALISTLLGAVAGDTIGSSGVLALTGNGNYVIRSPSFKNGTVASAGAATWGSGLTGVSGTVSAANSLVGTTAADQIGLSSVIALANGNYVVPSPNWANGATLSAGAVTWGNGATGRVGAVTTSNSLYGTQASDGIGSTGVVALSNSNYVVISPNWDNGATTNVGAVTWGNGSTGTTGVVSTSNSLYGTTASDQVGSGGVTVLNNGNYVVITPNWDNGATANVGAVTWGNGSTGITGAVSISNSLYGTTLTDQVGSGGVSALTNGNYVVVSTLWDNGATANVGAVTWGNGSTGITGAVSTSNSLYGTTASDQIGSGGVTVLTNGNYVVRSPLWDNGGVLNVGAATWGNGSTGTTGAVSTGNSVYGSANSDQVSSGGVTALFNGNYVVSSPLWNNGATSDTGAATWGNGSTGTTGAVSVANSLVGTTASDQVSSGGVTALTNGNYVVISPIWDNPPTTNVGAVTWGNGATGIVGAVSSANSLRGSASNDLSGVTVTALTNGNYVVCASAWRNGALANAGAATWGNGSAGITGPISTANSLYGATAGVAVGSGTAVALTNGNYVVRSPTWNNGITGTLGAVTWGNGSTGSTGAVNATNSLVGSTLGDQVGGPTGTGGVTALANGNYVVISPLWNNGATTDAGAATFGNGTSGIAGILSTQNSIVGTSTSTLLSSVISDNTADNTFAVTFTKTPGAVFVGLETPNQITYPRVQNQTMTIPPSFLTNTLNGGTAVILQANNDITLSSAITTSGNGSLTLEAGRSIAINANITMANGSFTAVANEPLSSGVIDAQRDAGNATLAVANNITINAGTGSISLSLLNGEGKTNSGSGDLTIGDSAVLQCSGSGEISLFAQENNVVLGTNSLLQTVNGNLMITAGVDISAANPMTMSTTGTGQLILIVDNLFPTSPLFGNGSALFPNATLQTNGGKLLIYTSQRSLNQVPAVINGVPYVPGPEPVNSVTEKWGVYYPNSSGIPFTIFYKTPVPPPAPSPSPSPSAAGLFFLGSALDVSPFQDWLNFWYKDAYLGVDPFAPYFTPKGFSLCRIPSLVDRDGSLRPVKYIDN